MTASPSSGASSDETGTWQGLWRGSPCVPHTPLDEDLRRSKQYPRTLVPAPEGLRQPVVFDPALMHFGNAYRAGEPHFTDEEDGRRWRLARRTALDSVLAAVADGPWADHLVLRGSALMATWFGDAAREPGDLDFVVVPRAWAFEDPRTQRLFEDLARDAAARGDDGVRFDASAAVTEDIWTYDRVPGRRLLLPWTAPGVPGGTVQIDVVFDEPLPEPPQLTDLSPLGDGPGCRLLTVTREVSLGWKLLWLITDSHPQGKDLYDAVLLAESSTPTYQVLRDAVVLGGVEGLRPAGEWWMRTIGMESDVEWRHFAQEYPWAESYPSYVSRLGRALQPFLEAAAELPGRNTYEGWVRWLQPLIETVRSTAPLHPAGAVGHLEEGGRDGLLAAVVVVREVEGRERVDNEQALRLVLSNRAHWEAWRRAENWWVDLLDQLD